MAYLMDRERVYDMFFKCSGKKYIFDLGKKIGRSANKEGVSPLTADIHQLITKKLLMFPHPLPQFFLQTAWLNQVIVQ